MPSKQTQKVDDSGVGCVVMEGKGEQGVVGEDSDVDAEEGTAQMRSKQTQKVDDSGVGGVVVEGKGEQGVVGEDSDVDAEEGVGGREAAAGE
ncbi:uncharacterized protein A4U43_C07F20250 [Asparagus officinalis]|uniref:Uncharacterized protein n=1 Tax=Asparagus officinalis TaxID=4686 RepID=A0A5P1EFC2_ASPOF|nr:uncharacterized protein A4U43_C07F20250 [Asparagus officinalis]